jgi:CHAT domain-containing protein
LLTLSACETGLIDFDNASDEYIGLPSGFLYAGSPSVVCTLWAVDQVSTAFLLIKFYENLRESLRNYQ